MKQLLTYLGALTVATSVFAAEKPALDVRDFGAKGDGVTKDTVAIQKALDACAAAGGGKVFVSDGTFLTGSLVLGANTTLEITPHASLVGSADIADYPLVNVRWEGEFREGHRALLSASNAANLTITGGGSIFGAPVALSKLRNPRGPVLIELTGCTNAVLENFTTQYQNLWSIHTLFCKNLTARGLTLRSVGANGDGLDVDSCDGVTIEHCDINTGDDAISLKSGRGLAAQTLARPTQNVVIRDCQLHSSIYAALGFGTEMSGGIRNVKLENCVISGKQNAIFIKSREGRGGFMENISGENLTVLKSPTFVGIDLTSKGIQATDPVPGETNQWPHVQNISFKNIRVQDVSALVAGKNVPAVRPVDGFVLNDVSGTCAHGIALANMTNVKISGIHVTGYDGPLISTQNVSGTGLELSVK
jgi:polygalacturonase